MDHDGTDPAATKTGLADRLKARTWDLHREAERTGILGDLLRGAAGLDGYALLLRNLLPVYEALETALAGAPPGPLRDIARPELYRSMALRRDLTHLAGPDWPARIPVLAGAERYARRIIAVAQADPALLAPHAYVRYLGDLNGGQILKRLLGRTLHLGPEGLNLYDFAGIGDAAAYAAAYREALDASVGGSAPEPLVEEAATAFRLGIALSNEVAAHARGLAPTG